MTIYIYILFFLITWRSDNTHSVFYICTHTDKQITNQLGTQQNVEKKKKHLQSQFEKKKNCTINVILFGRIDNNYIHSY